MRVNNGRLYLNEKDREKLWKAYMSNIINEEIECSQIADADTVHGPIEKVMREEIDESFIHSKIGKAHEQFEVYAEMILASGGV